MNLAVRDQAFFWFWHATVLGLAGLAVVLGWTDVLLHNGREHAVAVMGCLYLLGVCLSAVRLRQFSRDGSNMPLDIVEHRLAGIALIGKLLVLVGLLGTVGGMIVGLDGITAESAADATAAGGMVGGMLGGLGLAFTATFVGIALNIAITVGARFVANVAMRPWYSRHA